MDASLKEEVITAGKLEIRPAARVARAGNRLLMLSVREYELLLALSRRADRIVTREELYKAAWGGRFRKDERSVDVYVRKLRVKLAEALPEWRFIHTHFGFGYRFAAEPSQNVHKDVTAR